jgi:hypothetical protein
MARALTGQQDQVYAHVRPTGLEQTVAAVLLVSTAPTAPVCAQLTADEQETVHPVQRATACVFV